MTTEVRREHAVVGRPLPRIEGPEKVTGKTVYAADITLPRMLYARILRSPHAHARIRRIDTARARALEGVEFVVTAADLPPYRKNPGARHGLLLAEDEVVYQGQAVAAVLATREDLAEEALDLIQVEYEPLPAVIDPEEAMRPDAPPARLASGAADRSEEAGHVTVDVKEEEGAGRGSPNVSNQIRFSRGDIEEGFNEADVIVERTWRSALVHQGYIEPHAAVADYDATTGELTIWTSTQGPFHTRDELARLFQLPETKIRVVGTEVGGGFGGKIFLIQGLAAALALVARRPVKLVYSRKDDLLSGVPSPQAIVHLRTGMRKDGTVTALQARLIYDAGAFPGAPVVPGALLVGGYYKFPHLDIQGFEVLTNKVSVGALRAPGAHNATLAIEAHMDLMARELGLDPLEVRLRNAVEEGDQLPNGQPLPRVGLRACLEALQRHPLWRDRAARKAGNGRPRGVGIAVGGWLGGLQPASAHVALNSDGTINVMVGSNDITGVNTAFAQIAAEELRVPVEQVTVSQGDTKTAPYAGMSAGSKTLYTVGRAVKLAAEDARRQILEVASQRLDAPVEELELADGEVRVKGDPSRTLTLERLGQLTTAFAARHAPIVGVGNVTARRSAPGFTAQMVELEVDPETGQITLLGMVGAQDAGFAVNPLAVAGQIEGGMTQGLGIGLWEEMVYDAAGNLKNPGLLDYRMPTAMDVPDLESVIVEVPSEEGPYGARIVGEPSITAGGAAIANAVADALGVWVDAIPVTPERVLRALGRLG
ncbi:MAG TPA: xanthine dehydrogenase family protein molybdopterin-binding subunit [Dehalococcoidia bacterium]